MTNKASLLPFAIVVLVAVLGCGRFTRQANTSQPKAAQDSASNTFTLSDKDWKSFDLDQTDITVELPGEPSDKTPAESQLPAGYKEIFSSMRIHAYDNVDFGSSYTQLVPTGKRAFEIKELADTSMAALKRQARDFKYELDIESPSKAKYDGTFTRNGRSFELKGCCIYQKSPARVWAVITLYPKENADGRSASERIINSATFAGSSETCN